MKLRLALAAAVAVAGGCTTPPADDGGCLAAPAAGTVLMRPGSAEHRRPVGHGSPIDWVPFAWFRPDGERVEAGEPLLRLDPATPERWIARAAPGLAEARAEAARRRLRLEQDRAALAAKRAELADRAVACRGGLESAARQAADQQALADLAVAAAERAAGRARHAADLATARMAESPAARHAARRAARAAADADLALAAARHARADAAQTAARDRDRLAADLAGVEAELGRADTDASGVFAELAALAARAEREERLGDRGLELRLKEDAERRRLAADPVVRARISGVVRCQPGLRAGDKMRRGTGIEVLADGGLEVSVTVPERWGATATPGTAVRLTVPSAAVHLDATVAASGTVRDEQGDARLTLALHPAAAAGEAARKLGPEGLRPGMQVEVGIVPGLPADAAAIPAWYVPDARLPRLRTPAGERAVTGFAADGTFVITSGLRPGERVLPPLGAGRRAATRAVGSLAAAESRVVSLASSSWEVVEVAPDGGAVVAGQVVARLAKVVEGWQDPERLAFDVRRAGLEAEAQRLVAEQEARLALDRARVAACQARLAAARARLDLAARLDAAVDPFAEARARAAAEAADDDVAVLDDLYRLACEPAARMALSALDRQAAEHDLARGRIAARRARLDLAAERRRDDVLARWAAADAQLAADEDADAARRGAGLALAAYGGALARAADDYRNALRSAQWQREQLADEEVRAPIAGLLLHRRDRQGQPLRPGQHVEGRDLFEIPVGPDRRLEIEVPERLWSRMRPGVALAVHCPALGAVPLPGRVLTVGGGLRPARGGDQAGEPVFPVTVQVDVPDPARALPGLTAWVEL